jgi:hypothetical protein
MCKYVINNLCTIFTWPLSVQAQYSRLCPTTSSFRYNGSLDTWTVVCLTVANPSYRLSLYRLRTDQAGKHSPYCCWSLFTSRLPSNRCPVGSMFTGPYAEFCLPSRSLETDCITPLFYCCLAQTTYKTQFPLYCCMLRSVYWTVAWQCFD